LTTWGFPVEEWRGYKPTRSQEYRATNHHGVDIMFRRDGRADVAYPPGTAGGSKMFFMPEGVGVHAAADGVVWSAGKASTGYFVVIDHAKPYATLYLHLATLDIPAKAAGPGGPAIKRGDRLGTVGASPVDPEGLRHLHFEIWQGGGSSSHVDPWPFISGAPLPSGGWKIAAFIAGLLALVGLSRKGGPMSPR
jgi:murein DD-endopeptidase MepM/ murein hydrolase activator NlpD